MSGNNVAHQVLDKLRQFEASWHAKQSELVKKHNELASQIVAIEALVKQIAGFAASEIGKFHGTMSKHIMTLGRTTQGLDLNVLALAEIMKEVVGQLTQVDAMFKKLRGPEPIGQSPIDLTEEDILQVKLDAESWFKDLMASAFKTAREAIEEAEKESLEKEAKEQAESMEAALAQKEQATIEEELKNSARLERKITNTISGGPGSAFPEGADIFGG